MTLPSSTCELWHYTSLQSLFEIVRHRAMWATDVRFLNDPLEYRHAFSILKQLVKRGLTDDKFGEAMAKELDQLDAFDTNSAPPMVTAFSDNADDLAQWRLYGDGGSGCALVFDIDSLTEAVSACNGEWIECVYPILESTSGASSSVEASLSALLDRWREEWNQHDPDDPRGQSERGVGLRESLRMDRDWERLKIALKPSGFAGEREFRAVFRGRTPDTRFRSRGHGMVPYREVSLFDSGARLSRIVIGPAVVDSLAETALFELRASGTLDGILMGSIEHSSHKFRR